MQSDDQLKISSGRTRSLMPPESAITDPFNLGNIRLVPVLHGHMQFALEVRRQFADCRPDAIAVELPETIEPKVFKAVKRLPFLSLIEYPLDDERMLLLIEPTDPFIEALRLADENDLTAACVDRDADEFVAVRQSFPDPVVSERIGYRDYTLAYYKEYENEQAPQLRQDVMREMTMAYHVRRLAENHRQVLFVFGLSHWHGLLEQLRHNQARPLGHVARTNVMLSHLGRRASREVLSEPPFLSSAYERWRQNQKDAPAPLRLQENANLLEKAFVNYHKETGATIGPSSRRNLFRFARNYSFLEGSFAPELWHLVIAARGIGDDNLAWDVFDLGTTYDWQTDQPGLAVANPSLDEFMKGSRRIQFHRKLLKRRRMLRSVKPRPDKQPEKWKKRWQGESICSHPPEDFLIDSYGDFIKKKAVQLIAAGNRRTEPFSSSMLDGIDIRETLRNWHERQIYVFENRRSAGQAGAVVIIFDYDEKGEQRFPYRMTWLGEPHDQSDLAFYSTPPGEDMVGPSISRCEYGGLLLSYPTMRLWDIWNDPYFAGARSKAERLLLAGLYYCEKRIVAYVAPRPPAPRMYDLAGRFGRKLLYIPLGSLSPLALNQIRTFHMLDGHFVRNWAKEYIF
jgi:hypothetical protein